MQEGYSMKRIDRIFAALHDLCLKPVPGKSSPGFSAQELADQLQLDRSNVSRDLNLLHNQGMIDKLPGKPALFFTFAEPKSSLSPKQAKQPPPPRNETGTAHNNTALSVKSDTLANLIGADGSLQTQVKQAQAAVLYPPRGLHTLLLGETGVGKSMFAETMYHFALENGRILAHAPFVAFNCADYASNPQLLISHLFGSVKGAYTGADKDKIGLIEKADGGILFLDEVHRLSPEGQEMLFYLIDRGLFRRLGEADTQRHADVLIVAATTENPTSFLLKTFYRRIPMVIRIPNLNERPFMERLALIRLFFHMEASRTNVPIKINKDALRSFCAYDCPGNIGQLKSDVQLSCAGAFLDSIKYKRQELNITLNVLPDHVKKGLLKPQQAADDIEYFLNRGDADLVINGQGGEIFANKNNFSSKNFYEVTEKRYFTLRQEGLTDEEIYKLIKADVELHFKRYLDVFSTGGRSRQEELTKIVGQVILDATEEVLALAEVTLNRVFPTNIYYGLSMHLASLVERIEQGKEIINPHVLHIREEYPTEFAAAEKMSRHLEEKLHLAIPFDEVGFISLFLTSSPEAETVDKLPRVGLLVIAHGESTAASMAEVANSLFGVSHAHFLNVQLNQPPEELLLEAEELVCRINQGKGVLLMVDMGFLLVFGELITAKTGIPVETVEMVSTPMVLEAVRKAYFTRCELTEVATAVGNLRPHCSTQSLTPDASGEKVILTACLTGQGSAVRLRGLLEDCIPELTEKLVQILPISIASGQLTDEELNALTSGREVLAVVGTFNPNLSGIPFFPAESVIAGTGLQKLRLLLHGLSENLSSLPEEKVSQDELLASIEQTFNRSLKYLNPRFFLEQSKKILAQIHVFFGNLDNGTIVGFVMHLGSSIERMIKNEYSSPPFPLRDQFIAEHGNELNSLKHILSDLEKTYHIQLEEDEICYLLRIIFQ
jgi:transcriptional regulator with AAA-type ATPase domain/transcriptional regulatory protein LevR